MNGVARPKLSSLQVSFFNRLGVCKGFLSRDSAVLSRFILDFLLPCSQNRDYSTLECQTNSVFLMVVYCLIQILYIKNYIDMSVNFSS